MDSICSAGVLPNDRNMKSQKEINDRAGQKASARGTRQSGE